jgi:hypothetical protein
MSSVFWNITPYSPLKVNRSFEGKCFIRFQGRWIIQARNQRKGDSKQNLLATLFTQVYSCYPEDGGDMFRRNVCWFQRTTRRYILEDRSLYKHRYENLKPYRRYFMLYSALESLRCDNVDSVADVSGGSYCFRHQVRSLYCESLFMYYI